MNPELLANFVVDREQLTIAIEREFAAPLALVWAAWTKPEILDQWVAPKPWHSETKTMEFKEGGHRLYAMVSPEGEKRWGREDYQKIDPQKSYSVFKTFCDENGAVTPGFPRSLWTHVFTDQGESTLVNIHIKYEDAAHLDMIIKVGFQEGITMGMANLDAYLESQL